MKNSRLESVCKCSKCNSPKTVEDLKAIAEFHKIIKNYLKMVELEKIKK